MGGEKEGRAGAGAGERKKPLMRGVLHQVAAAVSFVAGGAMVGHAAPDSKAMVAGAIYCLSLVFLFAASATYHRPDWEPRERKILRRIDHGAIFVLIAGTYSPIVLLTFESGTSAEKYVGFIWLLALFGILLSVFWPSAPKGLVAAICVGFGAIGLLEHKSFQLTGAELFVIGLGGVFYVIGAVVYAVRRPDPFPEVFGYHEVFHALTILATVCHFGVIWELTS
ncbi:adipoR/hemolysin-III-related protein [Chloropicon primus]|uniref:AdipoR/hemolysin-III-related protein n=1 Tax=Chloropicon primus TaxID=1764295 RepID=A0A5B8MG71_9CHLO|nr:adipoR/hemolysin-III-related protein [Chloropicon primus]UPQ98632.1 adipoR/hemolysin-III-related protein [Chloropicon primus]|eukprot:QDZ19423.1 adipoR/hemolysin-III-related protein [Chloropicon primus]